MKPAQVNPPECHVSAGTPLTPIIQTNATMSAPPATTDSTAVTLWISRYPTMVAMTLITPMTTMAMLVGSPVT